MPPGDILINALLIVLIIIASYNIKDSYESYINCDKECVNTRIRLRGI